MRERINDKGRLQHILSSINIILDNKDRFKLDEIESLLASEVDVRKK